MLVVSASHRERELLVDVLTGSGFAVLGATAGAASAVGLLDEVRPDVVVVDLEMPRMNGLDTVRLLRARRPLLGRVLHADGVDKTARSLAAAAGGCACVDWRDGEGALAREVVRSSARPRAPYLPILGSGTAEPVGAAGAAAQASPGGRRRWPAGGRQRQLQRSW